MVDWAGIGVVTGDDGLARCGWCTSAADHAAYHDDEWGRPVTDDVLLYEKRGKIEATIANAGATLVAQERH